MIYKVLGIFKVLYFNIGILNIFCIVVNLFIRGNLNGFLDRILKIRSRKEIIRRNSFELIKIYISWRLKWKNI